MSFFREKSDGPREVGGGGDDEIHVDVVSLGEGVRDKLEGMADSYLEAAGAGACEKAVVESATTPEAAAGPVEGEAGADEGVGGGGGDGRKGEHRFPNSKTAGDQLAVGMADGMEGEDFAIHAGEEPSAIGVAGNNPGEVQLAGEGGVDREREQVGAGGQPAFKGGKDRHGTFDGVGEAGANVLTELLFAEDRVGNCHLPRIVAFPC